MALTLVAVAATSAAAQYVKSSDDSTTGHETSGFNNESAQQRHAQARRLEGSWAITVTPVPPPGVPPLPPRHVYATFARGGAAIGSDRGLPFGSPQHGAWTHLGGNEFAYTLIQDLFDATGIFRARSR